MQKRLFILVSCFLLLVSTQVSAQIISTFAGDGLTTPYGDGGQATGAELISPYGIVLDAAGNLYITENTNQRVRKVTPSGIISTYAGTGAAGFSGDGGQATAAQLNGPIGIAIDALGNIYIADENNYRIRKVTTAGIISTIAGNGTNGYSGDGGAATAAELGTPTGVIINTAGTIYIADNGNQRVREITAAGIITTFAGTGTAGFSGDGGQATAAQLSNPSTLALDAGNNLYIADKSNNRIRRITTAGIINTIAGNGTAGYSGDGAAATGAELNVPNGVALDAAGNVYIADNTNDRIRKITTAGIISTLAGNGIAGFSGDGGAATSAELHGPARVAVDATNNIYIADVTNNRIRKVNTAGIIKTIVGNGLTSPIGDGGQATGAELNLPQAAIFDAAGNLFIADVGSSLIRKINTAGIITTVAGNGVCCGFSGDGGQATAAQLYNPVSIALDGTGNLYIADEYNQRIRKVTTAGIISTIAGNGTLGFSGDGGAATAAEFNYPLGMVFDGAGNLYIADTQNQRIRKVTTAGIISTIAGTGTGGYSGDGGAATAAEINWPWGLAIHPPGNLYIADNVNNRVRMINTMGIISTVAGNGTIGFSGDGVAATAAELNGPIGVVFDAANNLYIADNGNNRIRKIITTGIISTFAGNGTAGFSGDGGQATAAELNAPHAVTFDASGNLYISDDVNNRIRKVTAVSTTTITNQPPTVSPATICAGGSTTITIPGSQVGVGYALVNYPITSTVTIGSPQAGTGSSMNFPTGVLTTNATVTIVGVIPGTSTLVMNPPVVITVNPLPNASATVSSPTICAGTSSVITPSSSANTSYSLTPGGTFFSSITVTPTVTTNYILMVKDDLTTCTNTSTITIVVMHTPANVNWNPPPICVGGPAIDLNQTLVPVALHGGTWTVNGNIDSVLIISTASAGTTYTVTYAAGTGTCAASQTDTLTVHNLPPITVNSATVCAGTIATLTASGAATYTWNTGPIGDSITVFPTGNTNYTVTGMSIYGCVNTASTSVNVHFPPTINVNNATICAGATATLIASGASSYTWSTGATTATITPSPTVTTNYTVTGVGTHNCKASDTATVYVNPLPNLIVNSDSICAGDTALLVVKGANTYTWIPTTSLNTALDSFVIASPTVTTIYTITGTDSLTNCMGTTTSTVTIVAANSTFCSNSTTGSLQVHNAFSPNGDGLNEMFIIDNIGEYSANHVYIYNRWGQLLWNKAGYNNTSVVWDGKSTEGTTLYAGTYYYIIENAGPKSLKGWVEITSANK